MVRTVAQKVASLLGGDGTCFETESGQNLVDLAELHGARKQAGGRDIFRYVFPDGSVIVEAGGGWDFEGRTPFSWRM